MNDSTGMLIPKFLATQTCVIPDRLDYFLLQPCVTMSLHVRLDSRGEEGATGSAVSRICLVFTYWLPGVFSRLFGDNFIFFKWNVRKLIVPLASRKKKVCKNVCNVLFTV